MSTKGLTPKQELFCYMYVYETDGDASKAFRKAYDCTNYAEETVWVKACELKKNGKVQVRIAELEEERKKEIKDISLHAFDEAVQFLMRVLRLDFEDMYKPTGNGKYKLKDVSEMPKRIRDVIRLEVGRYNRLVPYDKMEAVRELAKLLGLNAPDKSEITVNKGTDAADVDFIL